MVVRVPDGFNGPTFRQGKRIALAKLEARSFSELPVVTDASRVQVYLNDGKTPAVITDAGGFGLLKVPSPSTGPLSLRFTKENYEPVAVKLSQDSAQGIPKIILKRIRSDLLVATHPGEVSVTVNGADRGKTDSKGELLLNGVPVKTPVRVRLRKNGFTDIEMKAKVAAVDTYLMEKVLMKPLRTALELSVDQPFADVYVKSGDKYGLLGETDVEGNITIRNVRLGRPVTVKIAKTGRRDKVLGPFVLSKGEPQIERPGIELEPAFASLKLETSRPGVTVEIDGKKIGDTADDGGILLREVQVGLPHTVQLSKIRIREPTNHRRNSRRGPRENLQLWQSLNG